MCPTPRSMLKFLGGDSKISVESNLACLANSWPLPVWPSRLAASGPEFQIYIFPPPTAKY